MDLSRFMPKFGADAELTEEELDEQDKAAGQRRFEVGRLGPRKFTPLTNGQIRRMQARSANAQQRKANQRYRKNWLVAEAQTATLKAQIQVALGIVPATPDGQRNAHLALIKGYGQYDDEGNLTNDPIETASEHLESALVQRQQVLAGNRR